MNYKELVEKGVDISEVATYNHYLAESIIGDLKEGTSIDLGMSEMDFVMELWDYSVIYHQEVDIAFKRDEELPGVACYEITDAVALRFLNAMKKEGGSMPNKEDFTKDVKKIVDTWTNVHLESDAGMSY